MQGNDDDMVEALGAISHAPDVMSLRAAVMQALALWGITAAFFVAPITRDARVGRILTNIGNSRIWERHYRARLHLIDPLPRLALEASTAFVWPDNVDLGALDRRERRYLRIMARQGLGRGIGTACYGPQGRTGFLGAVWRGEGKPGNRVMQSVNQVAQVSFQRYCLILREVSDIEPLSNRELEVLGWMCRGKSNPVMAEILGISRSSVDAYIRRLFAKLDVTDRTAACVKAYSLGLVVTDEMGRRTDRARRISPGASGDDQ
jgi:LuxR family transcriptional regulator/LuxR family quorum-sensing system transcriptional regulator CciR